MLDNLYLYDDVCECIRGGEYRQAAMVSWPLLDIAIVVQRGVVQSGTERPECGHR